MSVLTQKVMDYLKSQRQWTRRCRIDHARLQLLRCKETERPFWAEVLTKLGAPYNAETASH